MHARLTFQYKNRTNLVSSQNNVLKDPMTRSLGNNHVTLQSNCKYIPYMDALVPYGSGA
jgi:hypothetical protein